MLAIGEDELGEALAETIKCQTCEQFHDVLHADGKLADGSIGTRGLLSYYKCGDAAYLCGIRGREIK